MKQMSRKKCALWMLVLGLLFIFMAGSVQADWKATSAGRKYQLANGKYVKNRLYTIGKYYYYFDKNGVMQTGWVTFPAGKRYFGKTTGQMWTGLRKIGKYQYYFTSDGYRKSGWVLINGKYYFFGNTTGRMQKKKLVDNNNYYVDASGARKVTDGFVTVGGKKYFVKKGGLIAKNLTIYTKYLNYRADADGVIKIDTTNLGKNIAKFALKYEGNPYKYGGTSLTKGADCSGFVYALFKKFGINLLRSSYEQEKGPTKAQQKAGYTAGKSVTVSTKTLMPGDLLFYGVKGNSGHVALYIGNGKVIHAADENSGIRIDKYNYNKPVKAMRYW